ncbi:MAG: hypothetical protein IKB76_03845 [Kiritimatiellae bacterium]|nr:hypothetical protein [Kiritimatiellia bacterium]
MSEENGTILDLGSIDFTPDWAKKDAGVNLGKIRPERADREEGKGKREKGRGFGKPFGERKPFGEKKPFSKKPFGDRKPFAGAGRLRPEFERPKPLEAEVKILPETKALGTIIRKLQSDTHAYKLKDLAYFFLDNPSSVLLKITPRRDATGHSAPTPSAPVSFCQCKACGFASTEQGDVLEHVVSAHLGEYYDSKEVECEPPKGNFNCVAKCGLSGVLLGPPNIHEFNAVVKEMIRTKYPEMSEEQYRAHIEMVRDADTIEAWRKTATKKTVFFAKGTADREGAQSFSREQAEGEFKRTILPSLIDTPKNLMITADVAMKSPVKPLQWAVKDALEAERRAPYNMCFALRGAFHHRKMKFFRANDSRGPEFVTNVEYKEFDAEHAIPELAAAAKFVAEHPCCDKTEFPQVPDFEKHLAWLVTTGHAVAFTNGVYSMVEKFPKYGPQWKKRSAKPAAQTEAKSAAQTEAKPEVEEEKEEKSNETAPVVAE